MAKVTKLTHSSPNKIYYPKARALCCLFGVLVNTRHEPGKFPFTSKIIGNSNQQKSVMSNTAMMFITKPTLVMCFSFI